MFPTTRIALLACVFGSAATAAAAPASKLIRRAEDAIADRYIVVLDAAPAVSGARARPVADVHAVMDRLATTHNAKIGHRYTAALHGFAATMTAAEAEALAADPAVAYVEQDGLAYNTVTQQDAPWNLDRIDQQALPLDETFKLTADGGGVNAYVIDSGIRGTHSDIASRTLPGASIIYDANNQPDVNDCNGHGTLVASILGGSTWGVAKRVNLIPVRRSACEDSFPISDWIMAIDWVTDHAALPAVANISSTTNFPDEALDAAVRGLINAGVVVVVAAGNGNDDACNHSPGRVAEAITVAATSEQDARSEYSAYGSCVDLFAPGDNVTGAGIQSDSSTVTLQGTSLSAPMVAGAAAVYLSEHPFAKPAEVAIALTLGAASNKVTDPKGSANKLLNVMFFDPPKPGGDDPLVEGDPPATAAGCAAGGELGWAMVLLALGLVRPRRRKSS
ncbi:MAG: S8 family peptidase [Kofleriaceae bacterium]